MLSSLKQPRTGRVWNEYGRKWWLFPHWSDLWVFTQPSPSCRRQKQSQSKCWIGMWEAGIVVCRLLGRIPSAGWPVTASDLASYWGLLEGNSWWLKDLGSCHLCGRPGWKFWPLALAWPCPAYSRHWRSQSVVDQRSLNFSVSSLLFQVDESK